MQYKSVIIQSTVQLCQNNFHQLMPGRTPMPAAFINESFTDIVKSE